MANNSDTMARAAKLLGIEPDEVSKRLEKLPVDEVINVLDAITAGHDDVVQDLLGNDVDENDHTQDDAESEDELPDINPLFTKSDASKAKKKAHKRREREMEEEDAEPHVPNVGDDVIVGDDEGIVKMKNGPAETTGVMIDGETTMVKNKDIRKPVSEAAVVSGMQDIRRMQELAGMAPPSLDFAAVDLTNKMNAPASPLAPGSFDVEMPYSVEDEDAGYDAEVTVVAADPVTPPPAPAPAATPAPASAGIDGIMAQFDIIEDSLPGIVLADVKTVRARINDIMNKLNESTEGRKRKV